MDCPVRLGCSSRRTASPIRSETEIRTLIELNPIATRFKKTDPNATWLEDNIHSAKLSESLPRALQFAKRIGNTDLERWVRLELYGYNKDGGMSKDDVVPGYRAVTGRRIDQFDNMLDISRYPDLSIVNEYRFRFGVAKLEELASKQEMQNIADDQLINIIRENMGVEVVRFCFSPVEARGVLDIIRNKFSEMMLDCQSDANNAVLKKVWI